MEGTADMSKEADGEGAMDGDAGQDEQRAKRLRAKNRVLLFALLAFVVLIYFVSIVRMGGS